MNTISKSQAHDLFLKSKVTEKRSRAFWGDFMCYPPKDGYHFNQEKNRIFYQFRFWEMKEVSFWLNTGRVTAKNVKP